MSNIQIYLPLIGSSFKGNLLFFSFILGFFFFCMHLKGKNFFSHNYNTIVTSNKFNKTSQGESFFLNFLLCIRVWPINNVVIVSGEQQRDSAIHIHISILPKTHLPSRLPHNVEQSSLCYTIGPCWLPILNTAECTCPSQTP